jgi:siroheme synthase-like protein
MSAPAFPVFLRLQGRAVLVVGGGRVAATKLPALLEAGARVRVVAPEVQDDLRRPGVEVEVRPFAPGDLEGVWYVVAAAPPAVNRAVVEAAEARRIFVNAVDDVAVATAYLGSVLRRDGVTVAIGTDGAAPALSALLRRGLQALLPDDLERWVETAAALRPGWHAEGVPFEARRPALLAALNALYYREGVSG